MSKDFNKETTRIAINRLGDFIKDCKHTNTFPGMVESLVIVHSALIDAVKNDFHGLQMIAMVGQELGKYREFRDGGPSKVVDDLIEEVNSKQDKSQEEK